MKLWAAWAVCLIVVVVLVLLNAPIWVGSIAMVVWMYFYLQWILIVA